MEEISNEKQLEYIGQVKENFKGKSVDEIIHTLIAFTSSFAYMCDLSESQAMKSGEDFGGWVEFVLEAGSMRHS